MTLGIQFYTKFFSQKSLYEHFGFELVEQVSLNRLLVNNVIEVY